MKIRKSKSGKSKYVVVMEGVKHRCNKLKEIVTLTGLPLSTVNYKLYKVSKKPVGRPSGTGKFNYVLYYEDNTYECNTLKEAAEITGLSTSIMHKILNNKITGRKCTTPKKLSQIKIIKKLKKSITNVDNADS